ncbi:MAG TPA: hypothetical protein VGO45_08570, partial [Bacteroidia bacterium]|nr:hypothetical protein [Bacteroidia bacterium]
MTFYRTLFCLFACAIFAACQGKKEIPSASEAPSYTDSVIVRIFGSDTGLFRGVSLGMTLPQVKTLQKGKPEEEEEDYLSYSFGFKDTLQGNYYYNFEEGLDEIGIDIYREKQKECNWIFDRLKTYFTKKYGPFRSENRLLIWHVNNQGKEGAEVTLADESLDYGYGKLTVTIFP